MQVLSRVFLTQPAAFVSLVLEQQQQQQQQQGQGMEPAQGSGHPSLASYFLDRWLSVSSARFLEEVIGDFVCTCTCMCA